MITLLEGITTTPCGVLKLAAAPEPSANTPLPLPTSVVTIPMGVTSRMRLLKASHTTMTLLEGITAIPCGLLKLAAEPVPSAKAALPLPASVVTTPRGVTSRMRLFHVSATTMMPLEGSTTTPFGPLNLAAAPVPSAKVALPLPASVVTTPRGVTSLMRLLPSSATTIMPLEGITATPAGPLKPAAAPVPSPLPPPASVVTTPRGVTRRMRLL